MVLCVLLSDINLFISSSVIGWRNSCGGINPKQGSVLAATTNTSTAATLFGFAAQELSWESPVVLLSVLIS